MRGYLSSVLGASLLILLVLSYGAWFSLKDLDRALTEYVLLLDDVYVRASLEDRLYDTLQSAKTACEVGIASGSMDLASCSSLANSLVVAVFSEYNVVEVPPVVSPVLEGNQVSFVFVKDVKHYLGRALLYIPMGAEVG